MKKITLITAICAICTQAHSQWSLTGNAGTNVTSNFIGTTDNVSLRFRTNNANRLSITNAGKVGIGITSPVWKLDVKSGSINTDSLYRIQGVQVLKRTGSNLIQIGDATALVGIGNATPANTLDVTGNTLMTGSFVNTAASVDYYGLYGSCSNSPNFGYGVWGNGGWVGVQGNASLAGAGSRYGLRAYGENGTGNNYGVYGYGNGGTIAYGIYGTAVNATTNWAGYFAAGNVYISNKLRIGTAGTPSYPVHAVSNTTTIGYFVNTSGGNYNGVFGVSETAAGLGIGVRGDGGETGVNGVAQISGAGSRYGIKGLGKDGTANNYGGYFEAYSTAGTLTYGIYATTSGAGTLYAGYFAGNTFSTGTYQGSDRKLKSNIKPLTGAVEIINKLNPSVYTFKNDEYKQMNLPEGERMGLIADEVETVLPNLVKKAIQPAEYENHDEHNGKKISDAVEFKAVNYTELIPVLIGAVKELSKENKELKAEIETLKAEGRGQKTETTDGMIRVSTSEVSPAAMLGQNTPNPFDNSTIIPFRIPKECHSATILITEATGKIVRAIPVSCKETQLSLEAGLLAQGKYSYSLIVDGVTVDTKQMVLLK